MPRFKAKHITDLEPGCTVEIKGRRYMRVQSISRYDDLLVDLETGWLGPWTYLVLEDEMVNTVDAQWSCPACRSTGLSHCAHPDECGGMKLRKVSCGCREGTCESKPEGCRMTAEIRAGRAA